MSVTLDATTRGAEQAAMDAAQYLTFYVAGEEYAIGILRVREIIEYDTITRLPTAPRSIRGVINLRGSVVPVTDLALKFGLPETAVTKRTCVVIVEVRLDGEHMIMGVMADAVSQVVELHAGDIEPPPSFGTRIRAEYLLGMGRAGRKFVLLLDVDRVLAAEAEDLVAAVPSEDAAAATSGDAGDVAEVTGAVDAVDAVDGDPPMEPDPSASPYRE